MLQSLNYPKPESQNKWYSKISNWFKHFETESGKSNSLFLQRTYQKSSLISGEWGRRWEVCRLGRGFRLTCLYLLYSWLYICYRLYLHLYYYRKEWLCWRPRVRSGVGKRCGMSGKQNRGPIQVEMRWKLLYLYTSGEVRNRGFSQNLSKVIHWRKNTYLGIDLLVVVLW